MSRPVLYPLRPVESATVQFIDGPRRRRRVTIDHRPLNGITPAMLLDWFTHLGETMSYGGETIDRYLAWHPIDHIKWELARQAPAGGAGDGARFRMVEAFGGQARIHDRRGRTRREARRDGHPAGQANRGTGGVPTRAHLVGGRRRCPLRHGDGPRRAVTASVSRQHGCVSTVSRRQGARMGEAQHRRSGSAGVSAAAACFVD